MNFKHSKNLSPSQEGLAKVSSISWSANNMRLAVAQSDKRVALYDENGDKREAFSIKAYKVTIS
jgi:intraflagellar transport protein 172